MVFRLKQRSISMAADLGSVEAEMFDLLFNDSFSLSGYAV